MEAVYGCKPEEISLKERLKCKFSKRDTPAALYVMYINSGVYVHSFHPPPFSIISTDVIISQRAGLDPRGAVGRTDFISIGVHARQTLPSCESAALLTAPYTPSVKNGFNNVDVIKQT